MDKIFIGVIGIIGIAFALFLLYIVYKIAIQPIIYLIVGLVYKIRTRYYARKCEKMVKGSSITDEEYERAKAIIENMDEDTKGSFEEYMNKAANDPLNLDVGVVNSDDAWKYEERDEDGNIF